MSSTRTHPVLGGHFYVQIRNEKGAYRCMFGCGCTTDGIYYRSPMENGDVDPNYRCPKNNGGAYYLQLFEARVHVAQMELEEAQKELDETLESRKRMKLQKAVARVKAQQQIWR